MFWKWTLIHKYVILWNVKKGRSEFNIRFIFQNINKMAYFIFSHFCFKLYMYDMNCENFLNIFFLREKFDTNLGVA